MTERSILKWINDNLGPVIDRAISDEKVSNPDLIYNKDWLASIAMRETGFLIDRYVTAKLRVDVIHSLMKGDYSKREGEKEKSYHGFGYWQIDINSYPRFVKSGEWKDPYKTCRKAIDVLEEKRLYLQPRFPGLQEDELHRAIMAAYNCGQGNVREVLESGVSIDTRTHQGNYSAEVWRFRQIYLSL